MPAAITVRSPDTGPSSIGRATALLSSVTTQANRPFWPRCTTVLGSAMTFLRMSSSARALTNSPGHSRSSLLANIALRRNVAVDWSMMLSMSRSVPVESCRRLFWSNAITSTGPRIIASRRSSSTCIGSVNITADGWVSTTVAIARTSEAWTRFPGSTERTPTRPSLGDLICV